MRSVRNLSTNTGKGEGEVGVARGNGEELVTTERVAFLRPYL